MESSSAGRHSLKVYLPAVADVKKISGGPDASGHYIRLQGGGRAASMMQPQGFLGARGLQGRWAKANAGISAMAKTGAFVKMTAAGGLEADTCTGKQRSS